LTADLTRMRRKIYRGVNGVRHGRVNVQRARLVGPAHLWQMKRAFQIEFLEARGLSPGHVVVDVGCGVLRGGIPLIDYLEPGGYIGFEVRADVLGEAHCELAQSGLAAKAPSLLLAADLATTTLGRPVDLVWAFSVLFHMPEETVDATFAFAANNLAPDGRLFANVNIGDARTASWQGFPVAWRPLAFYQAAAHEHGFELTDLGSLGDLGHRSGVGSQDAQRMLQLQRR